MEVIQTTKTTFPDNVPAQPLTETEQEELRQLEAWQALQDQAAREQR